MLQELEAQHTAKRQVLSLLPLFSAPKYSQETGTVITTFVFCPKIQPRDRYCHYYLCFLPHIQPRDRYCHYYLCFLPHIQPRDRYCHYYLCFLPHIQPRDRYCHYYLYFLPHIQPRDRYCHYYLCFLPQNTAKRQVLSLLPLFSAPKHSQETGTVITTFVFCPIYSQETGTVITTFVFCPKIQPRDRYCHYYLCFLPHVQPSDRYCHYYLYFLPHIQPRDRYCHYYLCFLPLNTAKRQVLSIQPWFSAPKHSQETGTVITTFVFCPKTQPRDRYCHYYLCFLPQNTAKRQVLSLLPLFSAPKHSQETGTVITTFVFCPKTQPRDRYCHYYLCFLPQNTAKRQVLSLLPLFSAPKHSQETGTVITTFVFCPKTQPRDRYCHCYLCFLPQNTAKRQVLSLLPLFSAPKHSQETGTVIATFVFCPKTQPRDRYCHCYLCFLPQNTAKRQVLSLLPLFSAPKYSQETGTVIATFVFCPQIQPRDRYCHCYLCFLPPNTAKRQVLSLLPLFSAPKYSQETGTVIATFVFCPQIQPRDRYCHCYLCFLPPNTAKRQVLSLLPLFSAPKYSQETGTVITTFVFCPKTQPRDRYCHYYLCFLPQNTAKRQVPSLLPLFSAPKHSQETGTVITTFVFCPKTQPRDRYCHYYLCFLPQNTAKRQVLSLLPLFSAPKHSQETGTVITTFVFCPKTQPRDRYCHYYLCFLPPKHSQETGTVITTFVFCPKTQPRDRYCHYYLCFLPQNTAKRQVLSLLPLFSAPKHSQETGTVITTFVFCPKTQPRDRYCHYYLCFLPQNTAKRQVLSLLPLFSAPKHSQETGTVITTFVFCPKTQPRDRYCHYYLCFLPQNTAKRQVLSLLPLFSAPKHSQETGTVITTFVFCPKIQPRDRYCHYYLCFLPQNTAKRQVLSLLPLFSAPKYSQETGTVITTFVFCPKIQPRDRYCHYYLCFLPYYIQPRDRYHHYYLAFCPKYS